MRQVHGGVRYSIAPWWRAAVGVCCTKTPDPHETASYAIHGTGADPVGDETCDMVHAGVLIGERQPPTPAAHYCANRLRAARCPRAARAYHLRVVRCLRAACAHHLRVVRCLRAAGSRRLRATQCPEHARRPRYGGDPSPCLPQARVVEEMTCRTGSARCGRRPASWTPAWRWFSPAGGVSGGGVKDLVLSVQYRQHLHGYNTHDQTRSSYTPARSLPQRVSESPNSTNRPCLRPSSAITPHAGIPPARLSSLTHIQAQGVYAGGGNQGPPARPPHGVRAQSHTVMHDVPPQGYLGLRFAASRTMRPPSGQAHPATTADRRVDASNATTLRTRELWETRRGTRLGGRAD